MKVLRGMTIAIAMSVLAVGVASGQEKKIKRSDLPPAVEKAMAEVSKGAAIKGFSKETENGKTTYEVEPNRTVAEVEEEVALDSLPAEVKEGLNAKAAGGKILKVESLTKKGKLVAYEAHIEAEGKRHEIQVGPDGKPLDHEE